MIIWDLLQEADDQVRFSSAWDHQTSRAKLTWVFFHCNKWTVTTDHCASVKFFCLWAHQYIFIFGLMPRKSFHHPYLSLWIYVFLLINAAQWLCSTQGLKMYPPPLVIAPHSFYLPSFNFVFISNHFDLFYGTMHVIVGRVGDGILKRQSCLYWIECIAVL